MYRIPVGCYKIPGTEKRTGSAAPSPDRRVRSVRTMVRLLSIRSSSFSGWSLMDAQDWTRPLLFDPARIIYCSTTSSISVSELMPVKIPKPFTMLVCGVTRFWLLLPLSRYNAA